MTDANEKRWRLMAEKERVDRDLAAVRVDLQIAKGQAAAHGRYMRPADFARLELRRVDLGQRSQAIQRELSMLVPSVGKKMLMRNLLRDIRADPQAARWHGAIDEALGEGP